MAMPASARLREVVVAQPPSFPLYVQDYLTGTMAMSPAERGAYVDCLCYQWAVDGIPGDDTERLARVMRCAPAEAKRIWAVIKTKFKRSDDGLYRNDRMEQVRASKQKWHESRVENGTKGGRPPKQKTTRPDGQNLVDNHMVPFSSSSESTTQRDARALAPLNAEPARRRSYADPQGFRTDLNAAAHIVVGEGQVVSVPATWAQKACREYGLTLKDIDAFAVWTKAWIAQHGFEDGGKRLPWLDARLAEWRSTRRAAGASDAAFEATEKLLAEQAKRRANLEPVETVLEGLRAGRASR